MSSKKHFKLSIIIISYNVKKKLLECCQKVINYPHSKLIVIDNNSNDNSPKALATTFSKKLTLVKNRTNRGFAKAVNQGIKKAKGSYILLLNPDTTPNYQAITTMLTFLKTHPQTAFVGGRMYHAKTRKINGTYVNQPNFMTALFEFTNLKKLVPNNQYYRDFYYVGQKISKPKLVFGLSGGFLMFPKKIITDIDYLDEHFFMYLEDLDWGIRARAKGYHNYYLPNASILHDSGSSSRHSPYRINVAAWRDSRDYFFQKHTRSPFARMLLNLAFKLDDMLIDIIHKLKNQPKQ